MPSNNPSTASVLTLSGSAFSLSNIKAPSNNTNSVVVTQGGTVVETSVTNNHYYSTVTLGTNPPTINDTIVASKSSITIGTLVPTISISETASYRNITLGTLAPKVNESEFPSKSTITLGTYIPSASVSVNAPLSHISLSSSAALSVNSSIYIPTKSTSFINLYTIGGTVLETTNISSTGISRISLLTNRPSVSEIDTVSLSTITLGTHAPTLNSSVNVFTSSVSAITNSTLASGSANVTTGLSHVGLNILGVTTGNTIVVSASVSVLSIGTLKPTIGVEQKQNLLDGFPINYVPINSSIIFVPSKNRVALKLKNKSGRGYSLKL